MKPTGGRSQLVCTALAAVLVAASLSACGSGSTSTSSSAAAVAQTQPPRETASAGGGCRSVAQPAPKAVGDLSKPTGKLDPAKRYVVDLQTNCGTIEIELDVKRAPKTAASFAYLVRRGFFDDLTFHRVVAGFVIQGGDPAGNGSGGPGYTVVEPPPSDLQYTRGVVAMAKTTAEPSGASGSQFFIVTGANIGLPPQYALLGHVVGGETTVDAISEAATNPGPSGENSTPSSPIVISRATLSIS